MAGHLSVGLGTSTRVEGTLRIDPRVLLTSRLLELSHVELQGAISAELNENPALEQQHHDEIPLQDHHILPHLHASALKPRGDDRELWRSLPSDETMPDWIDLAASHTTLDQHLRAQLLPGIATELRSVGEFVLGSLDENGYLTESPEEIALGARCSVAEAEEVVAALRACDPPGVGAAGVAESLQAQLRSDETLEGRLGARIVAEHLDEFAVRRTGKIARRYGVMPGVVEAAFARILECTPFPAEGFAKRQRAPKSLAATADLTLRHSEEGWSVEPRGADPAMLGIDPGYRERLAVLGRGRDTAEERRHLSHYVSRAQEFIACLEERKRTMARIGAYLVEHQGDFVLTGDYAYLQPLTRAEIARALGLHESTVSRATADKFVQIANGEVVAFEIFFKPALRVQKMIEGILAAEDPMRPLSDERIAAMLAERGVCVARRTVNKYRDRNRLLSSRRRRSA